MMAFLENSLIKLWGEATDPHSFMQLLAAHGGVPNMQAFNTNRVSIMHKVRLVFDGLAEEFHIMGYGYFDLLVDHNQMRSLKVAKPANDNFYAKEFKALKSA